MFARINRPDEQSPCAIIIIRAPVIPHVVIVIIPAISKAIWPTDE